MGISDAILFIPFGKFVGTCRSRFFEKEGKTLEIKFGFRFIVSGV